LLKNVLDACLGAFIWWFMGFPIALGDSSGKFAGGKDFFMMDLTKELTNNPTYFATWMFQWAFAATAATIVSGAVAERCKFVAYLVYTTALTAFIYPVVVHWAWSSEGWLSAWVSEDEKPFLKANGFMDFAGSGVVHMTGGAAALMGSIFLGPRTGRFTPAGSVVDMPGHSTVLAALGTFILWFGWYGFNPGSTLAVVDASSTIALCAVTTTLSAAAGAVSSLFFDTFLGVITNGEAEYDLTMAMNGCLGGLVGITAGCSVVEPWAALIIGLVSGVVYVLSSKLLVSLKIDDAVDAIPVHFFNGMWGCIATGLFASRRYVTMTYGDKYSPGLFYGSGSLLGCEICGILFIIAWVTAIMTPFFFALNMLGMFRVDPIEEKVGLDISHHKGAAYDLTGPAEGDVAELAEKRATAHGKSGFEDSA
jgi:Amt family ammonium transporter